MRKLLIIIILILSVGVYYRLSAPAPGMPGMPDMSAAIPVSIAAVQEKRWWRGMSSQVA